MHGPNKIIHFDWLSAVTEINRRLHYFDQCPMNWWNPFWASFTSWTANTPVGPTPRRPIKPSAANTSPATLLVQTYPCRSGLPPHKASSFPSSLSKPSQPFLLTNKSLLFSNINFILSYLNFCFLFPKYLKFY